MTLKNIFLVGFFLLISVSSPARAEDKTCDIAKSAIQAASIIRGLDIKSTVPCYVEDRDSVRSHIMGLVNEKTPPTKMHLEGLTYKAIGLIPDSFDYEKGLIDLYVSQLGGYYDPEHKFFVMAGWMPAVFQTTIAVHELTHALQDQYYDLTKFVDAKIENSDLLLAHSALVEGDATAVMLDYDRRAAGLTPLAAEPNVESVMLQNVVGGTFTIGASGAPESLQLTLLFPYTSGLRFVHTLLRKGGFHEIDNAFRNPPNSTTEILHPDRYLAGGFKPHVFSDADVLGTEKGQPVYRDTLGEFAVSVLLGSFERDKNKVIEAAAGWQGDRVVVVERGDKHLFLWRTIWNSPADADHFAALYKAALQTKYGTAFGDTVTLKETGAEVSVSILR